MKTALFKLKNKSNKFKKQKENKTNEFSRSSLIRAADLHRLVGGGATACRRMRLEMADLLVLGASEGFIG